MKEYIYKDGSGSICKDLNSGLHESLVRAPIIILTALFCSLNRRYISVHNTLPVLGELRDKIMYSEKRGVSQSEG
jgi:hypothetical protein